MKRLLLKMDKPLLFSMLILFIIGLIMVFSSSNIESFMRYGNSPYYFFLKQGAFLLVGFLTFLVLIRIPLAFYTKYMWFIIGGCILLLLLLFGYATTINKTVSWFDFGPVSIQPSEFAKVAIIIFIGCFYEKNRDKLNTYEIVLTPIIVGMIIIGLVLFQPDLGTAIILTGILVALFMSIPIDKNIRKKLLQICIVGLIMVGFVLLISGKTIFTKTQFERFNFFAPCQRFETTGYHVCNGYIAINNGGLLGVGLGNSTQKYEYLPEAHTDFIFAIVLEELGLIISLAIVTLIGFLILRMIMIARRAHNIRGAAIAYGCAIYIFLHVVINLTGLLGLLPMTGVPLPFFSYGGSFALNLFIALALTQRVKIESYDYATKKVK